MDLKLKESSFLDRAVLFFIFLFLASLSVSIFVNQIGYYGALLLLLYKYFKEKENPFSVNSLEIFLLLYIIAEILSTIFAVDKGASFHNLLKRFLLLPMIYVVSAAANDFRKAKFFLLTYLGFALLSVVLYLGFSLRYYLLNLYQIEQSGPGIYQYPITTSELMSFTVVILFAFLIDEKNKLKVRLWSLAGFALTSLALLATYKRTGWIGAAAGILIVIIIKRKWLLLAPIVLAALLLVIFEKEKSEVIIYNTSNELQEVKNIKTGGRAYDVFAEKNNFWLADYENGLIKYSDDKPVKKISVPSPVSNLFPVNDSLFLAGLIDTRYVLFKKDSIEGAIVVNEFASPGFTISFCHNNKSLYILDKDSGLTVYPEYKQNNKSIRLPEYEWAEKVFCDSNLIVMYSANEGVVVYQINDAVPQKKILSNKFNSEISYIDFINHQLLIEDNSSLKSFKLENYKLVLIEESKDLRGIIRSEINDSSLYLLSNKGNIFKTSFPLTGSLKLEKTYRTGFLPNSITFSEGKLYATKLKNSRFASIIDRYQPSNYTRFALWHAGIKIFKDYPVFGVGDIDLQKLYIKYKRFFDKEIQGHMHNNYVHILVTLGAFGFIIVMMLLIKLFLLYYKIFKTLEDEIFSSSFAAGAVGCFISFLFAGLTEWNFGDHEVITMVWFITGLNIAFYKIYLNSKKSM